MLLTRLFFFCNVLCTLICFYVSWTFLFYTDGFFLSLWYCHLTFFALTSFNIIACSASFEKNQSIPSFFFLLLVIIYCCTPFQLILAVRKMRLIDAEVQLKLFPMLSLSLLLLIFYLVLVVFIPLGT